MQNQGITILQIVLTIIIAIILITIAVFFGSGIPREANIASVYNEMKELKGALDEANIIGRIRKSGSSLVIFDEVAIPKASASQYADIFGENATGEYYYLDFTKSKELKNVLEIENINNDYILDANDMNIYIVKGVTVVNKDEVTDIYSLKDVEKYYKNLYK